MILVVAFDIGADLVEAPDYIVENASEYEAPFLAWLCNEENDHAYWASKYGGRYNLCYRSDAFVEWLNLFPLKDTTEKAKTIATHVIDYDETLPCIFF